MLLVVVFRALITAKCSDWEILALSTTTGSLLPALETKGTAVEHELALRIVIITSCMFRLGDEPLESSRQWLILSLNPTSLCLIDAVTEAELRVPCFHI